MNISIDLRGGYGAISLENFRKISSELEILATKEIPHDERKKALVKDPTVRERKIKVESFSRPLSWYRVEDYAIDEENKLFLIGYAQYNSNEIIDRARNGGGGSGG